ncbi:hypothetical protein FP2506_02490 [Fulvimarina pelagi HTCC2506]|uniref:Glycosyltransferase RgtA/B/C/D-like domain-containing protein n=2 Tax=Fulvimarina pelagi TaxID=217511 RepID=Q0FYC2_9HYPH|nr:hypothetical protein [Fulvimarina pelagi]EAU40073.1 hypothetical protein FP2506_02490 [Fulvimarina pelagi HTCC2506]BAT31112.1 hypothetical protein [Fulvimarina pelagi]
MSDITSQPERLTGSRLGFTLPTLLLGLATALLFTLLTFPITVPIGPFYWDTFIYFDAANRLHDGQMPSVDFFAPAGPLGYWLFAFLNGIFKQAQPALLAQYMILLIAAPLLAAVLADVDQRSRTAALALLLPFLLFVALPINGTPYSSYPGIDGFGYYNRQSIHLLYVLTAALLFATNRTVIVAVLIGTMTALFLTKITGFVSGGLLCAFAVLAGRVRISEGFVILAGFAVLLLGLELATGVTSAYVADLTTLAIMNDGVLLQRFLQAGSLHFGICASAALLCLALFYAERKDLLAGMRDLVRETSLARLNALCDRGPIWLGIALFAGLFFETQNTGSQPFVFIWPVVLAIIVDIRRQKGKIRLICLTLAAATTLPSAVSTIHNAARAAVGQLQYVSMDLPYMKTLDQVSQRQEIVERSATVLDLYKRYPDTFQGYADRKLLPSFTFYTEQDTQLTWLRAVSEGVAAIKAYETANDVRFETIFSLNFTNPFPYLMDRSAPKGLPIGADPTRTVPEPSDAVLAELEATDLVLYPKCPVTSANDELYAFYEPVLSVRQRIAISPCWDGLIKE